MKIVSLPAFILSAATALGATTAFAATQSGTVTVHGRDYETIIREFQQRGGTVLTGEVRVYNRSWGCNPLAPGDCEDVVQRVLNADSISTNGGVNASPIREIIGKR
ncbi:hypothetical protein [uncultured Roseobacter sp.]|uniref:hypothetical protein n=1 Tax=uncultured Roseobacter sp. TaxID=114847 RepID=UPI00260D9A7B|nr:hypothetical protein [uncultured Roseobacter sp.]